MENQEAIDFYLSGQTKGEVCRKYNLTRQKFNKILKSAGFELKEKTRCIDMTGKTIGFWKVIEKDTSKKTTVGYATRWLCLCTKCNEIHSISGDTLRRGESFQCKECFRLSSHTGYDNCSGSTVAQILANANKRNMKFLVDPKYLSELFDQQDGKCALSGMDIHFSPPNKKFKYKLATASLDRIDAFEDYIYGNLRWVHKDVNQMRWWYPDDYFLYFVGKIANLDRDEISDVQYEPILTKKHHAWTGYGNISGKSFYVLKRGADSRNLEFNITIEDIWNLYVKQKGRCSLSGLEIMLTNGYEDKLKTASVDRIDSSKGYTLDNIQWVHKHINVMKVDFDQDYFIQLCKTINDYQRSKGVEIMNFKVPKLDRLK